MTDDADALRSSSSLLSPESRTGNTIRFASYTRNKLLHSNRDKPISARLPQPTWPCFAECTTPESPTRTADGTPTSFQTPARSQSTERRMRHLSSDKVQNSRNLTHAHPKTKMHARPRSQTGKRKQRK